METEGEVTKEDGDLGFTILGDIENQKAEKVHRVLPNWLANPSVIENVSDLKTCKLEDLSGLDEKLLAKLQECGFTHFFPVQQQVIPAILKCVRHGLQAGIGGFRPSDMCVSAPTGSGKTLAFVIPIVQALMKRIVCQVRALVVLPTRDLAMQVHQVFSRISKGTGLKVVLTAGHKTLSQEQSSLVKEGNCGFMSLADIIVATPGRLVDHISKTEGFTLQYLRFLVIDEADRMIDQISRDWIRQVEKAAYTSVDGSVVRKYHTKMTVANAFKIQLPLQKLLFSATLSQNPEKLMQLNLFQPRLFTSVVKATNDPDSILKKEGEFVGKYTTPAGLTEHLIQCDAGEKPLMVLYLLEKFKLSQVLCFTNTVEATHRLHLLLKLCRGSSVGEFSANLTPAQRTRLLKQFKDGEVQILVCSDAMARGMDIVEANAVICYDVPPFIKTYIHRVGRTARAGREGTAYTLVLDKQRKRFESMLKDAGKGNVQWMKVKRKALQPHIEDYEGALQKLPEVLQNEEKGKKS
ncbi:ATP-dependent RNA helicase DDX51-like [Ptychodera flava]|uniref:ATP-dependent RNA helicase DDX51-like n=1 Tax=Ptychodera flava TaxID=63121 RepID=UPI003969BF68